MNEITLSPINAYPAKRYAIMAMPVFIDKELKTKITQVGKTECLDILEDMPVNLSGPRPVRVKIADGIEGYVDELKLGIEPVRVIKTSKAYMRPDRGRKTVGTIYNGFNGYSVDGLIKDKWNNVLVFFGASPVRGWVDSSAVETASKELEKNEEQSGHVRPDF